MRSRPRPAGPKRRVYGRRKGRPLRPGRQALLDDLLPRVRVPVREGARIDPARLFEPAPSRVWLEIGFGAGEHLARQAAANPEVGFLGSEFFLNGVASLLRHIAEDGLENIRVWDEDARDLIDALPDAAIERVFLLFPDPWPKARHEDRRFVSQPNLDALARILTDGGELRIASDHPVYQAWTLEQLGERPDFEEMRRHAGAWPDRPADWPETRYEAKAIRQGRQCLYLAYRRRPRGQRKARKTLRNGPS